LIVNPPRSSSAIVSDTYPIAEVLITLGGLFLIGLSADLLGRLTALPRVTLLLVSGFLIGPAVFDWLPPFTEKLFPILTDIALAMVGFLLGQKLTLPALRKFGRSIIMLSIGETVATSLLVFSVLSLFGVPIVVALLLAGIAPATAPAATMDVVTESKAHGKFTDTLLGIVAIDDAWGLLIFSVFLAIAQATTGTSGAVDVLLVGAWEISGAILLGVLLGLPMAYITGRILPGEPTQAEALGIILLGAGLAVWLDVSYILASIVLGITVANFAQHHNRPFHEIEGIEWPFLILFFLLAGASLELDALAQVGVLGTAYIFLRVTGRILGTRLGGWIGGADPQTRRWIGLALLPQAGVAIGMALLASQRFPDYKHIVLPTILASTVIFELVGPVMTRYALQRMGEISD